MLFNKSKSVETGSLEFYECELAQQFFTSFTDLVAAQTQHFHSRIDFQRSAESLTTGVSDSVAVQIQPFHSRIDFQRRAESLATGVARRVEN